MFNLFRRTKIKDWEIDFLKTVFQKYQMKKVKKFLEKKNANRG